MLKTPRADITKLMELHGGAEAIKAAGQVVEREEEPVAAEAE